MGLSVAKVVYKGYNQAYLVAFNVDYFDFGPFLYLIFQNPDPNKRLFKSPVFFDLRSSKGLCAIFRVSTVSNQKTDPFLSGLSQE